MDAARSKEEIEAKENDEVIELAMNLIDCESLSGYEQPMVEILKSWLENRGWIVQLQEVSPQQSTPNGKARHNIYAHRPDIQISSKGAGPRVLFNSHIDTVRACSLLYYLTLVCIIMASYWQSCPAYSKTTPFYYPPGPSNYIFV